MFRVACLVLALVAACSAAALQEDRFPEHRISEDRIPEDHITEDHTSEDRIPKDLIPEDGTSENRIVGGANAWNGLVPWQVSLRNNNHHFCGGSIINHRWILTAAHCLTSLTPATVTAVTNTLYLNWGGDHYRTAHFVIHPRYYAPLIRNDIGLVLTATNIIYRGNTVQPARLPTSHFTAVNYPGLVSGWGQTSHPGNPPNHLQYLRVNIIAQTQCRATNPAFVTDENICTLNRQGQGTCFGDSGGPLTADGILVGVVSWVVPCARGSPDGYARVFSFIDWMRSLTG